MRKQDPEKLARIYAATLQLVLQEGFSALKMSEVAKVAKVATGTVYVYFENKEALIQQLYLSLQSNNRAAIVKGFDGTAPFMIGFEKVWHNYTALLLQQPEVAAFLEQYHRSPFRALPVQQNTEALQPMMELLERGKAERLVKDLPTNLLVIQLNGAIQELVRWHHNGQIKAGPALLRKAFELAWDTIKR